MLKIKTKFRCIIAVYMFIPIAGMIIFAHDTPIFQTREFQGILGISVAAVILLAFCSPVLLGLRWILISQLAEISAACAKIKHGNYTYFTLPNEPSETGEENELVALMRDMNWMIRQIEYRETELEDRVSQRTGELETINAELIRARDAAHASARAKSRFLATMSHEIRTPMNAVIGMSDLALKTNPDPGQQEYLTVINSASKSLLNIINDILDFSKMDAGKLVLEKIPVRPRDLADEAADLFRAQVRESPIEFILNIDPRVPETVMGDPMRLRQVLVNLLSNAFKFTASGEVCLAIRPEPDQEDRFCFSVRDTGLGMDDATKKALFSPFTQADGSTTRKFGGTGLGLAISRKLVRMMGSDIRVHTTPGQGSCFSFVLDLESVSNDPRPLAVLPGILSGQGVIVAVAHQTTRRIIMDFLTDFGLLPRIFESPGAKQSSGMPGTDILAIVDADLADPEQVAAALTQHLPVIAVGSASPLSGDAIPGWADRLLLKPVKQSLLFDAVMDLCQPRTLPSPGADTQGLPGSGEPKILLVEDNQMNQKVAVEILRTAGITPVLATSGEQALAVLETRSFDAVLMDIQMPDMDGYAVTREIRARGWRTRVIGMSANAMDQDQRQGFAAGMDAYVTKPVDAGILFHTLERCIRKAIRPKTLLNRDHLPCDLPEDLPGIDKASALNRMGGDLRMLTELILAFSRDNAGVMEALEKLVQNRDKNELLARLHQLKGNAGTIGAAGLAQALSDCEALVKTCASPLDAENLAPALARCGKEFSSVFETARSLKSECPAGDITRETGLSPDLPDMMAELKILLDQNSLKAKGFSKQLAQTLAGTPFQSDAAQLRTQTGRFDFVNAQKTFGRLQAGVLSLLNNETGTPI